MYREAPRVDGASATTPVLSFSNEAEGSRALDHRIDDCSCWVANWNKVSCAAAKTLARLPALHHMGRHHMVLPATKPAPTCSCKLAPARCIMLRGEAGPGNKTSLVSICMHSSFP